MLGLSQPLRGPAQRKRGWFSLETEVANIFFFLFLRPPPATCHVFLELQDSFKISNRKIHEVTIEGHVIVFKKKERNLFWEKVSYARKNNFQIPEKSKWDLNSFSISQRWQERKLEGNDASVTVLTRVRAARRSAAPASPSGGAEGVAATACLRFLPLPTEWLRCFQSLS